LLFSKTKGHPSFTFLKIYFTHSCFSFYQCRERWRRI